MDRKYNLRLDLQFRCNNSVMKFRQSDNKTSDFFMRITSGGELFNIDNAIAILAAIKPNQDAQCQFLEVREGKVYADLNSNMKDQVGTYKAQALLIYEDERVSTDIIEYEVTEDNILNQLETEVQSTAEYTMLQQMLSRLSTVENSETLRKQAEISRAEAEKLREQAIEKIKEDTTKLISDTQKDISDYKDAKDTAINDDLVKYKEVTNQAIETYKSSKDTEINNNLKEYKSSTTDDIEEFKNTKSRELDDFKNTKNSEIDDYKREKDLAINQYVESKNLEINDYVAAKNRELDKYKEAKDKEIDLYKSNKDTLINNKITEVEAAKQNIVSTANNKISELDQAKTNMQNAVNSKIEEADNRITELQNFETQLDAIDSKNTEQDTRLKEIEYKNKVQDVKLQGLFNENSDGRLYIDGEGNSLKLEGSKEGLVEVDKVVGNTLVNLVVSSEKSINVSHGTSAKYPFKYNLVPCKDYTVIINIYGVDASELSRLSISPIHGSTGYTGRITKNGINIFKFNMDEGTENIDEFWVYFERWDNVNITSSNPMVKAITVLEGDYTNKPIPNECIEGMQSSFEENLVTQQMIDEGIEETENLGKYKYEVEVRGKNRCKGWSNWDTTHNGVVLTNLAYIRGFDKISSNITGTHNFYDINHNKIASIWGDVNITVPNNAIYVAIQKNKADVTKDMLIQIEEGTESTPYEPYYQKTKSVYLNSPLHKGDELIVEDGELKHYHKMRKVVLDGSVDEVWAIHSSVYENHVQFTYKCLDLKYNQIPICDKFYTRSYNTNENSEQCLIGGSKFIHLRLNKSKATDISTLRTHLQGNQVTVLYELEETYKEVIDTNSFLMEIPNNASISIKSVVPVQSVKATYTANIPSVYRLQETNNNQDNLIDISLCATDEMYMMIEPILEAMPQTININKRMVSKMVDMYVAMVIRGLKTIEEVPARYRKEVQAILDKLEK